MRAPRVLVAILTVIPGASWPQDNPVGPEFRVNTYTTSAQINPSVAADSSGNFVVAWASYQDGSSYGVYGQRYDSTGAALGAEFRVNTYTTDQQNYPSVAVDSSGNFVVVWSIGPPFFDRDIFSQRYASSGAPLGPEFRVNTYTTGYQANPSVAADSSGNFVVVWESGEFGGRDIFGQRYASSGAPLGPEFRVNTITTSAQLEASVAVEPSGNFIVVWNGYGALEPGVTFDVFGQRYASSGAPLGPEFRVNTYLTGHQGYAEVAVDPSGGFVVVWSSYESVFGQRYASSGAPLGPEFRVNTGFRPSLAVDSTGNFVVVWWDFSGADGDGWGIFGQLYENSGIPIGPQFPVNAYTTGLQSSPSVAGDPSGHFVVTWASFNQDGQFGGVFGQRFDSMVVPVDLVQFGVE